MVPLNVYDPDLFRYITFTNKEQYLQAVAQWKQDYELVSKLIRQQRLRKKEAQRAVQNTGWYTPQRVVLNRAYRSERNLRATVVKLIKVRAVMKTLAAQQWELALLLRTETAPQSKKP